MRKLALALVFSLLAAPSWGELTAIRFGRLIPAPGKVVLDAVVVVDGERVVKVGSAEGSVAANAKVIDLRRYTGIPGLIDVHTRWPLATLPTSWRSRAIRRRTSARSYTACAG